MTTLSLNYRGQLETERANAAREAETNRHNLATERIAERQLDLAERQFSESKNQFSVSNLNELRKLEIAQLNSDRNYAVALLQNQVASASLYESIRHNEVNEGQNQQKLDNELSAINTQHLVYQDNAQVKRMELQQDADKWRAKLATDLKIAGMQADASKYGSTSGIIGRTVQSALPYLITLGSKFLAPGM